MRVRVAPVDPAPASAPGGATADPTTPVAVDLYWTQHNAAERYLGRFSSLTTDTDVTVPFSVTGTLGGVRVQTIDALGRTSQYSAVAPVSAPPAPATSTPTTAPPTTKAPTSAPTSIPAPTAAPMTDSGAGNAPPSPPTESTAPSMLAFSGSTPRRGVVWAFGLVFAGFQLVRLSAAHRVVAQRSSLGCARTYTG